MHDTELRYGQSGASGASRTTNQSSIWSLCCQLRVSDLGSASLFAYLTYYARRAHPRDELSERFWPEDDFETARQKLNVAVSSLRQHLEPPGIPDGAVLTADRRVVGLNPAAVVTDVAEFEALLDLQPGDDAGARLQRAVELYRGTLLAGLDEPWIMLERQRLAERYVQALQRLAECFHHAGDLDLALDWSRRAINADPLREESHVDLMRLLLTAGQPAAALQQYRDLERRLSKELGCPPSPAAAALAREIRAGSPAGPALTQRPHAAKTAAEGRRSAESAKADFVPSDLDSSPGQARFRNVESPGGAVPLGSPFCVVRDADAQFAELYARTMSRHLSAGQERGRSRKGCGGASAEM